MQLQMQNNDLRTDAECIFCKIIRGEIPCNKIYEDAHVMSFLDIAPANKGHCLVMPRNHYGTLVVTPEIELALTIRAAKKIAQAMSAALGNQGFNILVNNRKEAGQIVPHMHFHIITRFDGDGIELNWQPKKYKGREIDEFADKIKSFL